MNLLDDLFQFIYKSNRFTLDASASLNHRIFKSLNVSIRSAFLDYSLVFDSISPYLLLHKLNISLVNIAVWLLYHPEPVYTTWEVRRDVWRQNRWLTIQAPFGVLFFLHISSSWLSMTLYLALQVTCLSVLMILPPFKKCLVMEIKIFPTTMSFIYDFTAQDGLKLSTFKCLFAPFRSSCPSESFFIRLETLARDYLVKYLRIIIDKNLKWTSRDSISVKKLSALLFQIRTAWHYKVKQSTVYRLSGLLYCPLFLLHV